MFRRPQKNHLEKESSSYKEEPINSYQKYGLKKTEFGSTAEPAVRLFDPTSTLEQEREEEIWGTEKGSSFPHHFNQSLKEEIPETTLGEGVSFRGELSFERLLRIDGTFEGELLSQGKVIVGPKGKVKANLNLREAIIEGEVKGDITVIERLELRGEAVIQGNITAKVLTVDEGVTICGLLRVLPKNESAID